MARRLVGPKLLRNLIDPEKVGALLQYRRERFLRGIAECLDPENPEKAYDQLLDKLRKALDEEGEEVGALMELFSRSKKAKKASKCIASVYAKALKELRASSLLDRMRERGIKAELVGSPLGINNLDQDLLKVNDLPSFGSLLGLHGKYGTGKSQMAKQVAVLASFTKWFLWKRIVGERKPVLALFIDTEGSTIKKSHIDQLVECRPKISMPIFEQLSKLLGIDPPSEEEIGEFREDFDVMIVSRTPAFNRIPDVFGEDERDILEALSLKLSSSEALEFFGVFFNAYKETVEIKEGQSIANAIFDTLREKAVEGKIIVGSIVLDSLGFLRSEISGQMNVLPQRNKAMGKILRELKGFATSVEALGVVTIQVYSGLEENKDHAMEDNVVMWGGSVLEHDVSYHIKISKDNTKSDIERTITTDDFPNYPRKSFTAYLTKCGLVDKKTFKKLV